MEAFPSLPWLLLPLFLLPLLLLATKRRRPTHSPMKLPPSPPGLPVIGNLHQLGKMPHVSINELSKKYGPLMLLDLGKVKTLVISSPEMAKEVLITHDLDCCSRPATTGARKIAYDFCDIVFGPYSDFWREMRKLCMIELFTLKRVKSFSHIRIDITKKVIDKMVKECNTPVNVGENVFFHVTNEFICRVAYGKSYEGKQFGDGSFHQAMDETLVMLSSFWASDFFPTVGKIWDRLTGRYRELERVFKRFDGFFERVIEEHEVEGREKDHHEDVVDILLRLSKDPQCTFHLTRNHIKGILMDVFIGGIDTTAVTGTWAMCELIRNPRVMKKVQAEVREVIGIKPMVEEDDLDKLPYLKMVVKETFRLHPPVPLLIPREFMRDSKIGGYDIPAKTRLLVSLWAIGRDPKVWKNPEEFYPERFEGSSIDFRGADFELLPFGAGRRICPGLTMGDIALHYLLANSLYLFDWKLPPGTTIKNLNMEEEFGLTIHKKEPLYLVPIKHEF